MTTNTPPAVSLADPAELLAAIPHLLGFTPADSIVVIALRAGPPAGVELALRADLPPPEAYAALAAQLLGPLRRSETTAVCVAVITAAQDGVPPHAALIDTLAESMAGAGIEVIDALWAPALAEGVRWRCYHDETCHGTLPDPGSTVLAALSASEGQITYASRAHLAAQLDPAEASVLARRAGLLDTAVFAPPSTAAGIALLRDAVRGARAGVLPTEDERLVALALALADHHARDACLGYTDDADLAAAERLWTTLVREIPVPERAEPAALLAFFAYQRGDGALAGLALDVAQEAQPEHQLAMLLRAVLEHGVRPGVLRAVARSGAAEATRRAAGGTEER